MRLATDQTLCFDDAGQTIPCSHSGQDGASADRSFSSPRRFRLEHEIVRDTLTGLLWLKNANPAEFPLSWDEAFRFVQSLNARVHVSGGWRLPTRQELFSLVSHQHINPSLPAGNPFEDVFAGYYWTATECARLSDQAWYIHFGGGRVYRGMKHGAYLVWPVSGSLDQAALAGSRFSYRGPLILDRRTQRMWYGAGLTAATPTTWQGAFELVNRMNREKTSGHGDWRLPNIRELESLVNLHRHSPAIFDDNVSISMPEGYWSSTTSTYEPRYAWVLYPRDGAVGVGFKPRAEFGVLPIRKTFDED